MIFMKFMNILQNIEELSLSSENNLEARALSLLQKYTGKPDACWSSELQWQAIYQVYQRQEDIIVIMATGSGKTMVALLPTLLGKNNELALIFLPLISLMTDYKRKLDIMKIPYDIFSPEMIWVKPKTKFLLVSADVSMSPRWPIFLKSLTETEKYKVNRLIFDESHTAMISTDYRKVMTLLDQLRIIPMQFVLLTATCPPSSEKYMMELFGMKPTSTVILRGRTDRPELQYIRQPRAADNKQALIRLDQIRKTQKDLLAVDARTMIFVPFITTGTEVSAHLKCAFYHSKDDSDKSKGLDYSGQLQRKEEIYNAWFKGTNPDGSRNDTIVATTALSAGNDYPSVRLVVHFNTPMEMISYIQEVSRGGRDGKPAKCILIPVVIHKKKNLDQDHKGIQAMKHYVLDETHCLRSVITGFCDGVKLFCYNEPRRQKCSLCSSTPPTQQNKKDLPLESSSISSSTSRKRKIYSPDDVFSALSDAAIARKTLYQQNELNYVDKFEMALSMFNSACAYCLMYDNAAKAHPLTSCPRFKDLWDTYKVWKNSVRYDKTFSNRSCYFCHVPRIGHLLHGTVGSFSDCVYPDIVAVVAFGVYIDADLLEAASIHFEMEWTSLQAFGKWLTELPTNKHSTHIAAVFLWFSNRKYSLF